MNEKAYGKDLSQNKRPAFTSGKRRKNAENSKAAQGTKPITEFSMTYLLLLHQHSL
jgi:hypothetical protein